MSQLTPKEIETFEQVFAMAKRPAREADWAKQLIADAEAVVERLKPTPSIQDLSNSFFSAPDRDRLEPLYRALMGRAFAVVSIGGGRVRIEAHTIYECPGPDVHSIIVTPE